ncbi:MAG: SagB/ThcOx family dehydrogenase [candidate division Zixibacteria bacterium]|nr:SagB/ThcOx family dehydrogenase [candidate division Zixibacteria bacterium]
MKPCGKLLLAMLLFISTGCAQSDETPAQTIGPRFHYETSYDESGIKGEAIGWGKQVPLYKEYKDAPKTRLPEPSPSELSVAKALQQRKSVREFSEAPLTLPQLSRLLLSADGLTQSRGGIARRSAPSAGALYPMEIYVIASKVVSLAAGLYHFQVSDSSLELINEGNLDDALYAAVNEQAAFVDSPVYLILTARFDRVTKKYGDRGYRYVYVEAGAVCQNIYLEAESLGLGTVVVGAFLDDAVNGLVAIDGRDEAALLLMPVGFPAE